MTPAKIENCKDGDKASNMEVKIFFVFFDNEEDALGD
jgi:hypothetical protein